ncbi:MAG: sugar-binding transcriptional regulator [Roseiarcus sp.]|jgi:deoxyribonucleoside regulator
MTAPISTSVRLPLDELREQLMVQVAKLYYDLEKTQTEIAAEVGLTRWQVSRLIREAREAGIVRIEIVPRSQRRPDLESQLQKVFALRDAVVVPSGLSDDEGISLESVAQAAGQYLAGINPKISLIGVSWGRTMAAVAHWLPPSWNDGVHVVLVNGATNVRSSSQQTNIVAERFAQAGNGTATLLPVPAIVGRKGTREVLEQDPIIANVLELAEQAPVVCFSVGALSHRSVLVESGYLDEADIDRLGARGAVGDILGHFIDGRGKIADPELDARTLGLRPELLRGKERAIAVSAGRAKHAILLTCIKARYVNVLVTDEATAVYLLEHGGG